MFRIRIGFNADPDPEPAFYLNVVPDPDPGSQTNADPEDPDHDPGQTLPSQKVGFWHENILYGNQWIWIQESQINADPDPKHCSHNYLSPSVGKNLSRDYGTHLRERNKKEKDEEANATNDDARDGEWEAPVGLDEGTRHQRSWPRKRKYLKNLNSGTFVSQY